MPSTERVIRGNLQKLRDLAKDEERGETDSSCHDKDGMKSRRVRKGGVKDFS